MMSFDDILTIVGTTILTSIVIVFILKNLMKKTIEYYFEVLLLKKETDIEIKKSVVESLFKNQMAIYPELIELIYRLKNSARECSNETTRNDMSLNTFIDLKILFVENLYKYKPFLPDDIFRKVHRYKTQIQEFSILLNEVTRSINVEDAPVDLTIRKMAEEQLITFYNKIECLFNEISPEIKQIFEEKFKF